MKSPLLVGMLLLSAAVGWAADATGPRPGTGTNGQGGHVQLRSLSIDAVKWTGGFWEDRMRRLREIYLPGTLDGSYLDLANGSSLRNFLRAAGMEKGGALGRSWSDGDCYMLLEVAARLYAQRPDDTLKRKLDYWIPIIARVQREDGLVDTWSILKDFDEASAKNWERFERQREKRGQLVGSHQYIFGHLYKAAVSHQRATGDNALLEIADKFLLHYLAQAEQPGPGRGAYGISPQVAYACGLRYAQTGEERFLRAMGQPFRSQSSLFGPPLRDAPEIFGHNTQSAHSLIGAAMLYGFTGEPALLAALRRLADNLLAGKIFITGAVAPVAVGDRPEQVVQGKKYGSTRMHEAVGASFDLPNDTAYCESCGQALYAEFLDWMFRLTGEARYMDAVERSLYNAVPGCVALDEPKFFYANPQEQGPASRRRRESEPETASNTGHYTWKRIYARNCACCPPKVMRALALAGEMAYSFNQEGLWVNLFGDNTVTAPLPGGGLLQCRQSSRYPWDGAIRIVVEHVVSDRPFAVFLRIPGWVEGAVRVAVNGEVVAGSSVSGGYRRIHRNWKSGDRIELELPMPVRLMAADSKIVAARGKMAVMRGPVVYCLEGDDVPTGVAFEHVSVPATVELTPSPSSELGGIVKLGGSLVHAASAPGTAHPLAGEANASTLYSPVRLAPGASPALFP